jgi:tRNA pseudouridine38-40 synthase
VLGDAVRFSIQWIKLMDENFHARFKATARRYRYIIYNAPHRPDYLPLLTTPFLDE